jgi:hypothetical protein
MPARIILVLAGLISVTLNVKYMVDWETRWSIWIDHWNSVWNPYTAHVVPVRVVGEGSEPAAFHEWHEWNTNLERRDPLLFREVSR